MITKISDWKNLKKINESGETDYTKKFIDEHNMITHESFKSVEDIEKVIMASEGVLNAFLKGKGINYPVKLQKEGKYFKYNSETIKTGTGAFGIFEQVISEAQYRNFGGAEVLSTTWNNEFYFAPEIWFGDLNLNYQAQRGGSNGMNVIVDRYNGYAEATIWFDVLDNKYITRKDAIEKRKAKGNTSESFNEGKKIGDESNEATINGVIEDLKKVKNLSKSDKITYLKQCIKTLKELLNILS